MCAECNIYATYSKYDILLYLQQYLYVYASVHVKFIFTTTALVFHKHCDSDDAVGVSAHTDRQGVRGRDPERAEQSGTSWYHG